MDFIVDTKTPGSAAWLRQSYGVDHLLTFASLRQLGLLVEQQPGETLTVMESKVGKLVNDKTAGDGAGYVQNHNVRSYSTNVTLN